jgi:hypothetical protein
MLWIFSLTALVLAVPGAIVSTLILVDRYHKRRAQHAKCLSE